MDLPEGLIEHAEALVRLDPRKPKQANLRRGVSAAYYALFHLLGRAVADSLVGTKSVSVNARFRRVLGHQAMKEACRWFAPNGQPPKSLVTLLGAAPQVQASVELRRVAEAFVVLQEERHRADYDVQALFTRQSATELVARARLAFDDWEAAKADALRSVFLVILLAGKGALPDR